MIIYTGSPSMLVADRLPKFLRKAEQVVSYIQSLGADDNITLFTPVVAVNAETSGARSTAPKIKTEDGNVKHEGTPASNLPMDPFEPLGRALSWHDARVRHVPYLVKRGMTSSHAEFIERADAVVVLIYDEVANGAGDGRKSATRQFNFACSVATELSKLNGRGPWAGEADEIPLLLVVVSSNPLGLFDLDIRGFSTVLHTSVYEENVARQIADLIFGV